MEKFVSFCKKHQFNGLETIVQDYGAARDSDDRRKMSQYTDSWADVLQEYTIWLKHHCAPASVKTYLVFLQSFLARAQKMNPDDELLSCLHSTLWIASLSLLLVGTSYFSFMSSLANFTDAFKFSLTGLMGSIDNCATFGQYFLGRIKRKAPQKGTEPPQHKNNPS